MAYARRARSRGQGSSALGSKDGQRRPRRRPLPLEGSPRPITAPNFSLAQTRVSSRATTRRPRALHSLVGGAGVRGIDKRARTASGRRKGAVPTASPSPARATRRHFWAQTPVTGTVPTHLLAGARQLVSSSQGPTLPSAIDTMDFKAAEELEGGASTTEFRSRVQSRKPKNRRSTALLSPSAAQFRGATNKFLAHDNDVRSGTCEVSLPARANVAFPGVRSRSIRGSTIDTCPSPVAFSTRSLARYVCHQCHLKYRRRDYVRSELFC